MSGRTTSIPSVNMAMAVSSDETAAFKRKLHRYLQLLEEYGGQKSWYRDPKVLGLTIESCRPSPTPSATFRFTITDDLCNSSNNLHGICAASIIDDLGTVLLGAMSRPGLFSRFGANKNLTTTFLRPVRVGGQVRVVCEMEYLGSRRALLKGRLFRVEGDELCIVSLNDRANTDPELGSKV